MLLLFIMILLDFTLIQTKLQCSQSVGSENAPSWRSLFFWVRYWLFNESRTIERITVHSLICSVRDGKRTKARSFGNAWFAPSDPSVHCARNESSFSQPMHFNTFLCKYISKKIVNTYVTRKVKHSESGDDKLNVIPALLLHFVLW